MASGSRFEQVAILGGGAWGTTLSLLLSGAGARVALWCFEPEVAEGIERSRENRKYLPGIPLPGAVRATAVVAEALPGADLVVFATPSGVARPVLERASPHVAAGTPVLNVTKGLVAGSGRPVSELVRALLPSAGPLAVLSGPNLAREVAQGLPGSTVVASADADLRGRLLAVLMSPSFRVYASDDAAGVELGGALKNIFALGAGVSDGLGYGDNTKAAYLTRALVEMIRAGVALGARRETFFGLSGTGDLMATAMSRHSRNRALGERLGRGEPLDRAVAALPGIAEGVETTRILHAFARAHGLDLPITAELHAILFEGRDPRAAVHSLMTRAPRDEMDGAAEGRP